MGLQVPPSVVYWRNARPGETAADRLQRALQEDWYPLLSTARRKYLIGELERRFPDEALEALKGWQPEPEQQAAFEIC